MTPGQPGRSRGPLSEVAAVFLKLGLIGFGGPAAHIALMREEAVRRRRWVSDQEFLDLLGATNLIPGPNSTELASLLGGARAGWPGLVVAGALFILPSMGLVLALAWAYVRLGAVPQAAWLLYGIKPVVIAVVVQALWALLGTAVKTPLLAAVGVGVFALALAGANEIALLFGGGAVVAAVESARRRGGRGGAALGLATLLAAPAPALAAQAAAAGLATLFFTFLKIGAVLYGSGYVLFAFLRADFVGRLGWLTDRQLLDAIAVGQLTPGPILTAATFVGYLVGGWPGGLLATLGIFLPSFVFVAASRPLVPRLRRAAWTGAFLDGVNVAALGLMAAVTLELGRAALVDGVTTLLALVATVLLIRFRAGPGWLFGGGGAIGLAYRFLTG